ncbi:unnamed protein product [Peniophora sp. CBMAI 1063]|nr:unnamed protein product [Peniophora sp. CBMAI 1063]
MGGSRDLSRTPSSRYTNRVPPPHPQAYPADLCMRSPPQLFIHPANDQVYGASSQHLRLFTSLVVHIPTNGTSLRPSQTAGRTHPSLMLLERSFDLVRVVAFFHLAVPCSVRESA